ncbi:MAG: cytochrome c [Hyphomonas sp.]|jgi:mono/diheme cytochrome c family protein|nr:cytochrome c [Hyphomonas sp.]
MTHPVSKSLWRKFTLTSACIATLGAPFALSLPASAQDTAGTEAATPAPAPEKPKVDVRKLFAMNCSWCHDGYGMHAGKGPKLAGTDLTHEQVYQRIEKGKSGAMPGFGKVLNKDQIQAFVDYIKALPNE